jgi:hypothetical protein
MLRTECLTMRVRNIKSYIAVAAAAAALGLGVAAPASASDAPARALHIASGTSGEGVLWALPTRSGGEVIAEYLHVEAHRRGNPTVEDRQVPRHPRHIHPWF